MSQGPLELSGMSDAQAAAVLLATDPHGFGGLVLRSRAGPERDDYLARLRALLPSGTPWRRLPPGAADEALDGELDLAATLAAGRPVRQRGLLAASDGGVIVLPMAERLQAPLAARLGAVLDTGRTARDGEPARIGLVALDEGIDDETLPPALGDRLAFRIDPLPGEHPEPWPAANDILTAARGRAPEVAVPDAIRQAIAAAAIAFGIDSLRPALMALRVARTAAALAGRGEVTAADAALAGRLVFAPRATRLPAAEAPSPGEAEPRPDPATGDESNLDGQEQTGRTPDETVREAVRSALPPGLLLGLEDAGRAARQSPGRSGAVQLATTRGRPAGVRRGVPQGGARLNLIETLRAAAPWQALRRPADRAAGDERRIAIRRDDLRVTRFKQRTETVTLFAVDASGSLALQRLNEAKGAIELLLAECYVRRDQVALLAFRGSGADLLLPPTRSLARAKRCLAALAGGGATPLAAALRASAALADGIRRRGRTPVVVLFTDGRANVTLDGSIDRARAEAEARDAARAVAGAGWRTLLVDAAPRPQAAARALATAMNATYLPLPRAEAAGLSRAIRQASAA